LIGEQVAAFPSRDEHVELLDIIAFGEIHCGTSISSRDDSASRRSKDSRSSNESEDTDHFADVLLLLKWWWWVFGGFVVVVEWKIEK
jgi:hypothetical protein